MVPAYYYFLIEEILLIPQAFDPTVASPIHTYIIRLPAVATDEYAHGYFHNIE